MRKGILLLALLAAAWASPEALADEPRIVSCHGCSDSQAKLTAQSQVPLSSPAGVYEVYVVDTINRRLRYYKVVAEREPGWKRNYARLRTAPPDYQGWFDQALGERDYVIAATKPSIVLPADFPVQGADEVFGNAFNQTVISEQINRHAPTRIVSALYGSALLVLRNVFSLRLQVEVGFPDGSTAKFELVSIDSLTGGHAFVFEYVEGSARDSDGNRIPDSADAFDPFEGYFSEDINISRFLLWAQRYNATWPNDKTIIQLPVPNHIVCVRDDSRQIFCWHH